MSALLIPCYRILMLDLGISTNVIAVLTLLTLSRMVRLGGRGRGGNDPPPPPDYMAAMMQQFALNRQFMENIMAQFPQQNQHGHHHQNAAVNLTTSPVSTPRCSATPSSPWMLMIGF